MKDLSSARSVFRLMAIIAFLIFAASASNAQCNLDAETSLYNKFLENFKGTPQQQKVAVQVGKDFIAKYGGCPSTSEKETTEYIKKWIFQYENSLLENSCINALNTTPEQAFDLCQPYIAKDPENLRPYLLLVLAGAKNRKSANAKFRENTVRAARRALDLIASGRTVSNWVVGKEREDAVASLNYFAGYFSLDSSPTDAQRFLTNAAKTSSAFSKEPAVYDALARAIYDSDYRPAATEYNDKCHVNPVSECDALFAKAGQMLDKVIDAYARAVAWSKDPVAITNTKNNLITLYRLRHNNSVEGLDKLIAEVLSKPLP